MLGAGDSGIRRAASGRGRPLANSILRLIWSEQRISRAEIARRAELSRSTVSEIVGSLLPTGLVAEIGAGASRGGRRPIVLEFQDDVCCILGLEMGATHVAAAVTDLRGRVLNWQQLDHPVRSDPVGTRKLILDLSRSVLSGWQTDRRRLVGVGVAVPSPIDPAHPDRLSTVVMPDWEGQSGLEATFAEFDVPVLIDNDANLGALAEHWWGAGRGVENFTYVKVGTGVGSGHVIRGEIYRGSTGVAGEIGHMVVDPNGGDCVCGLRGCLGTLVGSAAMTQRATTLLPHYPGSSLHTKEVAFSAIEDAALQGDPLAMRLAHDAGEHLGIAVAGMLNLMNPSLVIFGGGFTRLGDLVLDPLRATVRERTLVSSVKDSEIRTSELGPRAIAVGAATMVLKRALEDVRLIPFPAQSKSA